MRLFQYLLLLTLLYSCGRHKGKTADIIIHNATVYTMTDSDQKIEAIAIKDGKIIEIGAERQILNKYSADEYIDAQKKDVYPGLIDAHGHILNYARLKLSVDLVGCKSYDQMLLRIEKYQGKHNRPFIIGRGWDQSIWGENELPNNKKLNELFPDIPVCLFRVDGHALLANDKLIETSNLYERFKSDPELNQGGYIVYDNEQQPTGVFVDNAMKPILDILPDFPEADLMHEILEIQGELFSYGITGVHEAGVTAKEVRLIEKLIEKDQLSLNIYAMLLPTQKNMDFAKKNGVYSNKNLLIRSFKVYGDGALGSRGACLKQEYHDHPGHFGYLTTSLDRMMMIAELCETIGYQMNTHAIGDSANKTVLDIYAGIHTINPDHRWRIEHAQVVDPADQLLFAKYRIFPSVQPTHATSDQRWAEQRLGKDRMKGAYAYRSLLDQFGMIALGTDFPVEYPDPFRTIHAAVERTDIEGYPRGGFYPSEKLTLEECMKGMTIWAALAAFQENELGTIEVGKDATLVIFDKPVRSNVEFQPNFARTTIIKGKKVYSVE